MKQSLEQVLDTCLAELNSGADLEVVLGAHHEHADELRPMLAAAALVRMDVPPPVRKSARKQEFLHAVASRRRTVEATEGYITELKAGVPLAELLDRATPEMRPLIHAAWRMHTTPPPAPTADKYAEGKALLMAMAAQRRSERRAKLPGVSDKLRLTIDDLLAGLRPRPTALRRAWSGAVATLIVLIVLSVGVAGIGSAAASSLPGDSFYGVKELGRSAQLLFSFDPQRKAELNIEFCGQRLDEIEALKSEGRAVPVEALEEWLAGQRQALANIQQLPLEQRQLLVEMLLMRAAGADALHQGLRDALADPAALDEILAASGVVLSEAKASVGAGDDTRDDEAAERTEADRRSGELPEEKTVSGDTAPRPKPGASEASVVSPPMESAAEPADEQLPEPPAEAAADREFVQPAGDDASGGRHRDEPSSGAASSGSPSEPEPEATEPSPPAFSQPIFEEPTDTPEPVGPEEAPADPGGQPGEPPPEGPAPQPPPPPGHGEP